MPVLGICRAYGRISHKCLATNGDSYQITDRNLSGASNPDKHALLVGVFNLIAQAINRKYSTSPDVSSGQYDYNNISKS